VRIDDSGEGKKLRPPVQDEAAPAPTPASQTRSAPAPTLHPSAVVCGAGASIPTPGGQPGNPLGNLFFFIQDSSYCGSGGAKSIHDSSCSPLQNFHGSN
jgi:hypothetical protein